MKDKLQLMKDKIKILNGAIHVGYELLHLTKEQHEKAMLSLDKTKDVGILKEWLASQSGILYLYKSIKNILNHNVFNIIRMLDTGRNNIYGY